MAGRRRILFITWDGPQVSYLEGLFLPIFRSLQAHDLETDVLQFHWANADRIARISEQCRASSVGYTPVRVARSLGAVAAFLSALRGSRAILRAIEQLGPDILMPRGDMPALAVLAAGTRRVPPICFDADGLPADERVEFAGLSSRGPTYRTLKRIEAAVVRRSRTVLVRTPFAASVLAQRADVSEDRFHVVANGRDERIFQPDSQEARRETRRSLQLNHDAPLLIYAGSVGRQYRFDLIAKTALAVRARLPNSRLLILTGSPVEATAHLSSVDPSVLEMTDIRSPSQEELPRFIAAGDLGLGFRAITFSMRAVSPLKTGEYLLCGLPVFGTAGIGRTTAAEQAGVFKDEGVGLSAAVEWLAAEVLPRRQHYRELAREVGLRDFALSRSIDDYLGALESFATVSRNSRASLGA